MARTSSFCKGTYPVPHEQRGAIRGPGKSMSVAEAFDLVDTRLRPDVPELDDAVIADAAELRILDRVEGYFLNPNQMAL